MLFSPVPTSAPSTPETRAFPWPSFAAGLAGLLVLMFATLRSGFFQYDDFILLAQAQGQWSLARPLLFFTVSQNGLFTPLNNLIFFLEFRLFGLHPLGYECFSLLLHWTNTLLVAWIAWMLTRSRPAAWAAAIVFAVGFGKVEAVTWVAAFVHLVTTGCYLSSAACFLRWQETKNRRVYTLALLFFVLGMLSKEPIVTLPLMVAAASWLFGTGDRRQRLRAVAPFFALGVVYVLGMAAWQKFGPAALFLQHGIYKPGLSSVRNFGALGGMALPAPYGGMLRFLAHVPHLDGAYVLLSALVALLVAPLLAWAWLRGGKTVRFGVLWVVVSFLPFMFVSVGIASRYLYLPSAGFSLVVAGLAEQWLARGDRRQDARVLAAVVGVFALANIGLFAVWQRQQNENGAMRRVLIQAMAALPARAPQTGTVCAANVPSKYHDMDLALPLWIAHAPHFKMGTACQSAPRPVVHYTFQGGQLLP